MVETHTTNTQEMRMNFVWRFTVLTMVVLGSVVTESSPAEDVLRELHSKFAKYNKDLRLGKSDMMATAVFQLILFKLQAKYWWRARASLCEFRCTIYSRSLL